MKTIKEKDLSRLVMHSIHTLFYKHEHMRVVDAEHNVFTGGYSAENKGRPDLVGHLFGLHVEIELKVYPNHPSVEQKEQIRRVNTSGALAFMIVQKQEQYFLVLPDAVQTFSWKSKNRLGWVELPYVTQVKTLSLSAFMPLIALKINSMKELVK